MGKMVRRKEVVVWEGPRRGKIKARTAPTADTDAGYFLEWVSRSVREMSLLSAISHFEDALYYSALMGLEEAEEAQTQPQ